MANKKSQKPRVKAVAARASFRDWLFRGIALAAIVVFFVSQGVTQHYEGRVLPGVHVRRIPVAGMNREEVIALVDRYTTTLDDEGVLVEGFGRVIPVTPTVRSTREGSIDTSYDLMRVDAAATADAALGIGRTGNGVQQWLAMLALLTRGTTVPVQVAVNREGLEQFLRDSFGDLEHPAQDAHAVFNGESAVVVPETSGEVFDYVQAIDDIVQRVEQGDYEAVGLRVVDDKPRITEQDYRTVWPTLQRVRGHLPRTFILSEKDTLEGTIDFEPLLTVRRTGGTVAVGLDQKLFGAWLNQEVRPAIDVPVHEPQFEIKDGKVVSFHGGQSGRSVNAEQTRLLWEQQMIEGGEAPLTFVIDQIEPQQKVSDLNSLGIQELVAEAWTDFRGSPPNRIHNIHRGAELLDGVLVPPGENFSVIKALSPITIENGFLPELVIKGDRTKPEVGGGLCQVSTTAFRVALNAGVPVLERANHSYRVPYYEPPVGQDATIYDPAPDFKFKNDTSHHLLLKTQIVGTRLIYQLWGTKDARTVTMSQPKIWDITAPPEKQIIETEDLKPGQEKCVERAHVGSKASFVYTVTYPDGTIQKKEFFSQYKPWRAVCMVGKDPNAPPVVPENQSPPLEGEGH